MGEFRIGRRFAQHSYPDTPRGGGLAAFARNGAVMTGTQPLSAAGDKIVWTSVESGVPGTVVPITPRVTGNIRVLIVVVCENAGTANEMVVDLIIDGASAGATVSTIDAIVESTDGFITIPFNVDLGPGALSLNVQHTVEVKVVPLGAGTLTSVIGVSSIDLQELPLATG